MDGFGTDFETNQQLVDYLVQTRRLITPQLIDAFLAIDRANFVPSDLKNLSYHDEALPIGSEQTISQPTTVAIMLELLNPQSGMRVLDIGAGSGWTTALLAHIVAEKGSVIGLERIPTLVEYGQNNLAHYHFPQAEIKNATPSLGVPNQAFDRILVSAAAAELPNELNRQLKPSGTIVIPIDNSIWQIVKNDVSEVTKREFPGFVFVPLIQGNN